MYAANYTVYHHPPVLPPELNSVECKCKLINFNQYNLRVRIEICTFVSTHCFVPTFRKAKFCGVPSQAIVKVGCAVDKKDANTALST
jgi:hypothetical protein